MSFEECLDQFKAKEQPEDVLPLVGKEEAPARLRKLALAWGKIRLTRVEAKTNPAPDELGLWVWLWEQVEWDEEDLTKVAGVRGNLADAMDVLTGNRIIYPDGTITKYATKALQQTMKSQLKL